MGLQHDGLMTGLRAIVNRSFLLLCQWCHRVAIVVATVALAWLCSAAWGVAQSRSVIPTQDQGALWAQLLTAGVILAVGGFMIKMFLAFKDTATKQAEVDRAVAKKDLSDVEDRISKETHETAEAVKRMIYSLEGIAGRGGLLADTEMDRKRRHDLDNSVHRLAFAVTSLTFAVGDISKKLNIPFDAEKVRRSISSDEEPSR